MIRFIIRTGAATTLSLIAITNLGSCAIKRWVNSATQPSEAQAITPSTDVNSGLIALGSGDVHGDLIAPDSAVPQDSKPDTSELVNQAAVDLERILAEGLPRRKKETVPPAAVEATAPLSQESKIDSEGLTRADAEWNSKASAAKVVDSGNVETFNEAVNDEKLLALATRIASLLRERTSTGEPVISESVAMAMIDAYEEDACASLDLPGSVLRQGLGAEDLQTLVAARDAASGIIETPKVEDVREAIATVAPTPQLRISEAKLCTKVSAFGKYNEFPSNVFPFGKLSKAIVYTALEGFDSRPAVIGDPLAAGTSIKDQVSVELEQSLTLYQDHDDYQVWHRPAQRVVETAPAKRRDFYLIQIIELGPTLAPGRYNLKIRLRDRVTGIATESLIPIEIARR